jgi:hypothetical protein
MKVHPDISMKTQAMADTRRMAPDYWGSRSMCPKSGVRANSFSTGPDALPAPRSSAKLGQNVHSGDKVQPKNGSKMKVHPDICMKIKGPAKTRRKVV